jgi:hypothetical protein
LFGNIREKRLLICNFQIKLEWGKKERTICCTRNEGNGLAWLKTGILKLRGMRRGLEKER